MEHGTWNLGRRQLRRVVAVGIVLVALVVACGGGEDSFSGDEETPDILVSFPTASGDVTPRPRKTPIPSESPSPTPLKVCAPNPDPAQASVLQVEDPKPEQQVQVPFHVRTVMSQALGIPEADARIVALDQGGGQGERSDPADDFVTVVLSRRTGRERHVRIRRPDVQDHAGQRRV